VDLRHVATFAGPVTRERMKKTRGLEKMSVLKRGNRLSITPVEPAEYEIVRRLAGS
jgi:predicted RNA-binding protein with PUA-like domain